LKHFVILRNDVVAENVSLPDDADVTERFHPSVKLVQVLAPQTVGHVYDWQASTFNPPAPLQLSKDQLLAYAAARRYHVETGGITLNGVSVATDRQSQAMLSAAFNMVQQNPQFTTMWKGPDGNFAQLTAQQILGIAQAVGLHVAACFAAEAAVVAKINSGDYTTESHINAALVV
jgi:uncharacterized protein DUF4376